jgi:hypothetical protein
MIIQNHTDYTDYASVYYYIAVVLISMNIQVFIIFEEYIDFTAAHVINLIILA